MRPALPSLQLTSRGSSDRLYSIITTLFILLAKTLIIMNSVYFSSLNEGSFIRMKIMPSKLESLVITRLSLL